MKKYFLLLPIFILLLVSYRGDSFSFNGLSSNYLNNSIELNRSISSNSIIPISDFSKYLEPNYTFFSGISMLGIKTYERSVKDIMIDFRQYIGIKNVDYSNIYPQDIHSLDMLLINQESLDSNSNLYYKNRYGEIKINHDNTTKGVHLANQAYLLLSYLPQDHISNLSVLKIHNKLNGLNGYATDDTVEIRGNYLMDDSKFRALFSHELAHTYDTSYAGNSYSGLSQFSDFERPIYNDDYLVPFYKISWIDNFTKNQNLGSSSFVSKYAEIDPFEDFAESYALYVNQGNMFQCMASGSLALERKYNFLKYIFRDREYNTGSSYCDNRVIEDVTDI